MRVPELWSKHGGNRGAQGRGGPDPSRAADGDVAEDGTDTGGEFLNRQRQLNVLALLLHSAGSAEEMLSVLAEKGPQVTGASVVYPLLLDKRREVLHAAPLQGNSIPALDGLSAALETEVSDLELPIPVQSLRRRPLETGEVEVVNNLHDLLEDVVGKAACEAAQQALAPKRLVLAPMLMDGDPLGMIVFFLAEEELDHELLELLAGHATLALKNLKNLEEMGRFGEVDQVTW